MGVSHLISITGAGTGNPDLLTVLAKKRIEQADVILYDALFGEEILELASPNAEKIYVGKLCKDGQDQTNRQNEIHAKFLYWAKQNKKIVRLKIGDPMIYGRGAEEIRFCKQNNLNYEVIPGVTAGIAGASLCEIPLTERGKNRLILFYTAHIENGKFANLESILSVIKTGSPVVIYMGLNTLPILAEVLIENQINTNTPVQILSKVSQPGQKNYETTLGNVHQFLKNNQPETPTLIVVGKYAKKIIA